MATFPRRRLVWLNLGLLALAIAIVGTIFMAVPLLKPPHFLAGRPDIRNAGDPRNAAPALHPGWGLALLRDAGGIYAVSLPQPCAAPTLTVLPTAAEDAVSCAGQLTAARLLPHLLVWISGSRTYVDPGVPADPAYRATSKP